MATANDEVRKKLKALGTKVTKEIEAKESPRIEIPVRGLSNVEYDEKTGLLKLGSQVSKRSFLNYAHARKFMQTMLVANFAYNELLKTGIHTSLRDMFYALKRTLPNSNENTFEEQIESDHCVVDLEVSVDTLREDLHLSADVRGRVVGPVTIKDRGDTIDWSKLGSGGWAIPSNVEDIEFKKVNAKFILVIEKNAAFERLHEDKYWEKNNCIIVTTQGQAARGPRRLIQRLSTEHKLPVYVFTDGDAYGWYIYSVIKYGSMALAHTSDRLGTPDAKFLGLTMKDIEKYKLEKYTIKAKPVDIKRAKDMMKYDWFQTKAWQNELKTMLEKGYKAELEALSSKGLKFITETYLPDKIKNKDFLE
jgi:DNA topoisomerase-6 subunit A